MKSFVHNQPTKIIFGSGSIMKIGEIAAHYGKRCLIVTYQPGQTSAAQNNVSQAIQQRLVEAGIEVEYYYGAVPNPTTECVDEGIRAAKEFGATMVVALGGGSAIDTAKMIAFCTTNPGLTWDWMFAQFSNPFAFNEDPYNPPLHLIAISTTSGSGSHVTPAAVISVAAAREKNTVYHPALYPAVDIVDPELMLSVPAHVTADTGFDAFTHAFESYINRRATPISELLALESLRLNVRWLREAVRDGVNLEAREGMALADTLAGLSLSNAGASLPHPLGEILGGFYPRISHGRSMAVVYPGFMRCTWNSVPEKFARVGRLFNPALEELPAEKAAEQACNEFEIYLKDIGLWLSYEDLGVSRSDLEIFLKIAAPIATRMSPKAYTSDEVAQILSQAYQR